MAFLLCIYEAFGACCHPLWMHPIPSPKPFFASELGLCGTVPCEFECGQCLLLEGWGLGEKHGCNKPTYPTSMNVLNVHRLDLLEIRDIFFESNPFESSFWWSTETNQGWTPLLWRPGLGWLWCNLFGPQALVVFQLLRVWASQGV